tara:strand:+ start:58 stop:552 length:495 start_codon:yes stop_codon:yes gene_type:complete
MFKKFFEDKLPPLRDFHGIEVIKDSEKYLKVCCSLHDKDGESIELECDDVYDRSNHDKSFLFSTLEGQVIILEILHYGKWHEYEFLGASHVGWIPAEVEKIGLKKDEQKRAFNVFKELLLDTQKINGFSIIDKRHSIHSEPEFRSLIIRILNSKQFKEIEDVHL